jgi:hypothetical protein
MRSEEEMELQEVSQFIVVELLLIDWWAVRLAAGSYNSMYSLGDTVDQT